MFSSQLYLWCKDQIKYHLMERCDETKDEKVNLEKNVYQAMLERLHFIFQEFDNIYISFSVGKDSGLLLNIVLDFRDQILSFADNRCFSSKTLKHNTALQLLMEETFQMLEKRSSVELYWVCLPMATRTALSSYEMYWYPWDEKKEDIWIRPMPKHDYVINLEHNIMTTYHYKMHQEDLAKQFGRWYRLSHGNKKTICLLGIRADESLQRYSGFINKRHSYKNQCWITQQFKRSLQWFPFIRLVRRRYMACLLFV